MPNVRPVVLSGGAGTRLWPLSTKALPKQFANLVDGASLFAHALTRLDGNPWVGAPIVVAGKDHITQVMAISEAAAKSSPVVVIEPVGRNTAPAVIAAALVAEPADVLVVLPSDHLIADDDGFSSAVGVAVQEAEAGAIVTFGIVPTRAETGYGYIEADGSGAGPRRVLRFKEKPALAEAEAMIAAGGHFWNSGMFVFTASVLLDEAARFCPDVLAGVTEAITGVEDNRVQLGASFAGVGAISIDHAVMEKTDRAVVVPLEVGWDDIGSFEALWSVLPKDAHGNASVGDVVLEDVSGSLIHATSRTVAIAGVEDLVVVETPESVLVIPKSKSQMVRALADRARADRKSSD